jgi:hypothetical protein
MKWLWLFYRMNGVTHKIKAKLFIFSIINPNHTRDNKENVFNGEITPNKD